LKRRKKGIFNLKYNINPDTCWIVNILPSAMGIQIRMADTACL
jgi:hypothetical protein